MLRIYEAGLRENDFRIRIANFDNPLDSFLPKQRGLTLGGGLVERLPGFVEDVESFAPETHKSEILAALIVATNPNSKTIDKIVKDYNDSDDSKGVPVVTRFKLPSPVSARLNGLIYQDGGTNPNKGRLAGAMLLKGIQDPEKTGMLVRKYRTLKVGSIGADTMRSRVIRL